MRGHRLLDQVAVTSPCAQGRARRRRPSRGRDAVGRARRPLRPSLRGDPRLWRVPPFRGERFRAAAALRLPADVRGPASGGHAAPPAALDDRGPRPHGGQLPPGLPGLATAGAARMARRRVPDRARPHAPPHDILPLPGRGVCARRPFEPGRCPGQRRTRDRLSLRPGLRLRARAGGSAALPVRGCRRRHLRRPRRGRDLLRVRGRSGCAPLLRRAYRRRRLREARPVRACGEEGHEPDERAPSASTACRPGHVRPGRGARSWG